MLRASATSGHALLESARLALVPGVVHGFTTRTLGSVSFRDGATASGDAPALPDAVDRALAASPAGPGAWTRREIIQVHGCRAVTASEGQVTADAVVSSEAGDLLVIRVADCVPILTVGLEDGRPVAVGAIHAGWRGLTAGIIEEAIGLLRQRHPSASLLAAAGPCIGPCCFEIGPDVAQALARLGSGLIADGPGDRSHGDLPLAARQILVRLGVEVTPGPPPCTRCDPARFHSHRAAGAAAGRMGAFIGIQR